MGQFHTTLKTEQVTESTLLRKAEFVLTAPLIYESNTLEGELIFVPKGFRTDYASVPRLPIIYTLLGNLGNSAACIHDYLYTDPHTTSAKSCSPVDRITADKILRGAIIDGMVKDGSSETTILQSIKNIIYIGIAYCFYIGVRIGGASHWGKSKK